MTYRCGAAAEVEDGVRAVAVGMGSPHPEVEWSGFDRLQCLLEDVPHDVHAAFLRSGAQPGPRFSDVFVCWREGASGQWLADVECCMRKEGRLGAVCTIFRGHPGRCDWEYVDPASVAVQALAGQLAREWGHTHLFKPS